MKLNVKRTVLVGFAFLSILSFWQLYDGLVPKILTGTFGIEEAYSGFIMAFDNILALFLLPLFGSLSDKCKSPLGKRRPFILFGTIAAVILMMGLPILDNSYYSNPSPTKIILFIVNLGLLLIAMSTFRSPAVALMPDVTPKPLRSKGNAIINLMGAVGGVLYLIITSILYSKSRTEHLEHIDYVPIFLIVGGIMIVSLLVVLFGVNEPKLCKEQAEYEANHPEDNLSVKAEDSKEEKMPKAVKRSLIFLLLSVALWYIGYNGITTWFTVYADRMWGMEIGQASLCLTVATAGAIISYIPIGVVSGRFGRKLIIMLGVILLAACFFVGYVYTLLYHEFHFVLLILFALVGVAWAAINVNSFPMVVEMCSGSAIGKFTGLYYTFSMLAQIVTPVLAGKLLEISYKTLFPYAAIAVALAFVTMCFVKHGDNKVTVKKGLEAFDIDD